MKDTLTVIRERVSVRNYTNRPVAEAQVETLLRAAMAAPSSKNKQPWHFVLVTQKETMDALSARLPYAKMLHEAPLAIVVCADTAVHTGESAISWVMDCSAATQNLLLAAQAVELGAVWTGVYPYADRIAAVQEALQLPSHVMPLNVIAIGHPAKEEAPKDKWKPERIHQNKW
jgi:nitroreductase